MNIIEKPWNCLTICLMGTALLNIAVTACSGGITKTDGTIDEIVITLDVQGTVWVGGDEQNKLKSRQSLGAETITLEPGASALVVYPQTGAMERWTASKQVTSQLTQTGATPMDGLQIKKIPGKIPANSLAFLPNYTVAGAGHARSEIDPPGPRVAPIHESVVLTQTPTFDWSSAKPDNVTEDESFQVFVLRNSRKMISEKTTHDKLKIQKTLKPGKYFWKVVMLSGDTKGTEVAPLAGEGRDSKKSFRIADSEVAEEANALLDLAKNQSCNAAVIRFCASRLEHLNLFAEAISLYEQLVKSNPQDVVALTALRELYRRAGRAQEATECREAAEKLGYKFESPITPEPSGSP